MPPIEQSNNAPQIIPKAPQTASVFVDARMRSMPIATNAAKKPASEVRDRESSKKAKPIIPSTIIQRRRAGLYSVRANCIEAKHKIDKYTP
jgi:hypothetical protein